MVKFNPASIAKLRDLHGLSQAAFAKKIEAPRQRVAMWERGYVRPNVDSLAKILTVFGVSADVFFTINTATSSKS